MPDRGRSRADEDRGPAPTTTTLRREHQGPADRVSPALRALRQPRSLAPASARPAAGGGRALRAPLRVQRPALAAALARPAVPAARQRCAARERWARRRPAGRHFHHVVRACDRARGRGGTGGRRLSGPPAGLGRLSSALLRPDVSGDRAGRGSAPRGPAHARGVTASGRARPAGDRARALLSAHAPRRVRGLAAGIGDRRPGRARPAVRRVPVGGAGGGPARAPAAARRPGAGRCCTAIAIRRRSPPWPRSRAA